jgi:hypothetical protein
VAVMVALSLIPGGDGHEIVPERGSSCRERDREPADLRNPAHYPITAVCKVCGQPIRCERWLRAEWRHIRDGEDSSR